MLINSVNSTEGILFHGMCDCVCDVKLHVICFCRRKCRVCPGEMWTRRLFGVAVMVVVNGSGDVVSEEYEGGRKC